MRWSRQAAYHEVEPEQEEEGGDADMVVGAQTMRTAMQQMTIHSPSRQSSSASGMHSPRRTGRLRRLLRRCSRHPPSESVRCEGESCVSICLVA